MITRLLVANRGEIARRVFRTCRDSGITTVAVASDADLTAPHATEADLVAPLPGNAPTQTYLRTDLIIAAALATGADAIHPGYGFLSENAEFARAVTAAGITWVGPPADAIDAMGSKIASKEMMAKAGVPVLGDLDPDTVTPADLPVLIKASAGGGGRGMRIVRDLAELPGQIEAARAEAASAFGDPTVFCEPYVENGRHIEVQVLADQHGTIWTLGERECSIQRRHQKVVEEAPSPMVDADLRRRLCDAARAAAEVVGYVGAGTVEFLAGTDGRFYFLEMNTRLQVEHPVTECVTGLDLVAWQLRIAEGAPLPAGGEPEFDGHAIEVRLYAEEPAEDWRPTTGPIHAFDVPGVDAEFEIPAGYGLRLDAGFGAGDAIGVHYDAMLAKVIAWAPTRAEAARRLAAALESTRLHGLRTNRDLLVRVLRHPEFLDGEIDTGFFDRHGVENFARPLADGDAESRAALAAALAGAAANRAGARVLDDLPSGWRNVVSAPNLASFEGPRGQVDVRYRLTRSGLVADGHDGIKLVSAGPDSVTLDVGGVHRDYAVSTYPVSTHAASTHAASTHPGLVCVDSLEGAVALTPIPLLPEPTVELSAGSLVAPMPGVVLSILVEEGDAVVAGRPVLVMEAMKMQHTVTAPADGVVAAIKASVGQQVDAGFVLAVLADPTEGG